MIHKSTHCDIFLFKSLLWIIMFPTLHILNQEKPKHFPIRNLFGVFTMSPCHSHRYLLGFFRKALKRKLSWGCLKSYTQNINVMILDITFNQIRAFTFFSFTQNLGHLVKIDLASKWRISKVYTLLFVSIKMVISIKSWIYMINLIYTFNISSTENSFNFLL